MKKLFISTNLRDIWTICSDIKDLALCGNLFIRTLHPLRASLEGGQLSLQADPVFKTQFPLLLYVTLALVFNYPLPICLSRMYLPPLFFFFTLKPFPLIVLAEGYFPSGLIGVSPAHTSSPFREASRHMNPTLILPEVCFQNPACSFFAFSIHRTHKNVSCSPLPQPYSSHEAALCVTNSS